MSLLGRIMGQSNLTGIDQDLVIFRIEHGVKLLKPKDAAKEVQSPVNYNTGYTIGQLSELPFNFYFLDKKGSTLHMNQQCIDVCGFQSLDESLGKSLFDVSDPSCAETLIGNCNEVIAENKIKIFEENNIRKDGLSMQFLSVKSPCFNDKNELIGVFGCSIVLGKQSLPAALLQISQLGLLTATHAMTNTVLPTVNQNNDFLSERERLCLFHLCKGYTMKEIAKIIGLSPKTIETYIDRAKQKLNCQNKAELIAAFLKHS